MKATLDFPNAMLRETQASARALGISLDEFVSQAVAEKLASCRKPATEPCLECAGELAYLHEESLRVQRTIDQEFGRLEP